MQNYRSFVSAGAYLPALSWTLTAVPDPQIATFLTQIDARGINTPAYRNSDCEYEFRPINVNSVPIHSDMYSQAFLSGREIYTSLLTSVNKTGSTIHTQTVEVLGYVKSILNSE